ncbi:unnamed protein product, partial [Allacma fusca]
YCCKDQRQPKQFSTQHNCNKMMSKGGQSILIFTLTVLAITAVVTHGFPQIPGLHYCTDVPEPCVEDSECCSMWCFVGFCYEYEYDE